MFLNKLLRRVTVATRAPHWQVVREEAARAVQAQERGRQTRRKISQLSALLLETQTGARQRPVRVRRLRDEVARHYAAVASAAPAAAPAATLAAHATERGWHGTDL